VPTQQEVQEAQVKLLQQHLAARAERHQALEAWLLKELRAVIARTPPWPHRSFPP
jgi:hypothetical protein